MTAERKPRIGSLAQHLGRHPEHPARDDAATGGEIDAVLVPGAKPAGPASGHIHPGDHGVLAADVPDEVDRPVHEQPPEVGMITLAEQQDAGLDRHLGAAGDQLGELGVGQSVEDPQRTKIGDLHQTVAR